MYKEEKKTEREKENDLFDKKTKKKKKKKEGRLQQFDVDTQLTYNHRKKMRKNERWRKAEYGVHHYQQLGISSVFIFIFFFVILKIKMFSQ